MNAPINYKSFIYDKNYIVSKDSLFSKFSRDLNKFMLEEQAFFDGFQTVKLYYDNGQDDLAVALNSIFSINLLNFEAKKVKPIDYKLFQSADLFCTIELLNAKRENNELTESDKKFFYKPNEIKKVFIKGIRKKEYK